MGCATQIFHPRSESMDRFHLTRFAWFLEIVVGEEAAVVVALKPMVEMDLIKVGRNKFFPEFVGLAAQEGNLQAGEHGNQRLGDPIRTAANTGMREISLRSRLP